MQAFEAVRSFFAQYDLQSIGVVVALIGFFLYGIFVGRGRMVMTLLSTYLALAIITNTPLVTTLGRLIGGYNETAPLYWFLVLFALMMLLVWRSHILQDMQSERGPLWQSLLLTAFQIGLFFSTVAFFLPKEAVQAMPSWVREVFLGEVGRSFWLLAPVFFLAFVGKRVDNDITLE